MPVPKLLFQTWKSKTVIPDNFAYWSETFRSENPSYGYELWDDDDNRRFIAHDYPWFLETYEGFPLEIFRADAVRYFFLHRFGGVYADMDTECLRPLDPVVALGGVVLGRMGPNPGFRHSIPNVVMASEPGQEFWLLAISLMMTAERNVRPEFATGPVMLKRAVDSYIGQSEEVRRRIEEVRELMGQEAVGRTSLRVLPGNVFYPLDWNDRVHDIYLRQPLMRERRYLDRETALRLFPNSLTVTYWAHSWEADPARPAASQVTLG